MSLKRLVIVVASLVFLLGAASAQQVTVRSGETGLVLEITSLKGNPPSFQPVAVSKRWTWYGRFGRVAGWQRPAGTQPVNAVKITPYLDGDIVRIAVTVLRGEKFQDSEEAVATYAARENEKLTLTALQELGVEPFEIKVVRVAPQTSEPPVIVNKTISVEVVGIEPLLSTFPLYKLTLHNLSHKNISALQVNIMRDDRMSLSGLRQAQDNEVLIAAGESSELRQPLATRAEATPQGYAPAAPSKQQLIIASVVFEDGTYEGDAKPAAGFRGFVAGHKTELERVVPVLENALAGASSLESLRAQLTALSVEINDADVTTLTQAFPGYSREQVKLPIEVATRGIRRDLLDELNRFEQRQRSPGDFQDWLTKTRDRYSAWLARVSPASSAQR